MHINFKSKLNWIGLLTGACLTAMVLALSVAGAQAAPGYAPKTKTPTPSGGGSTATPTNTPSGGGGAHAHYVDCSLGTNGNGSQASPWNSVASASAHSYGPGDSLLFKRGMTCNGGFVANGSGSAAAPITLADYGTGAQPIIDGGTTNVAVIDLVNVSYYDVRNLTIRGGSLWGLRVDVTTEGLAVRHFYLSNLDISAVNHEALARNDSGLLAIAPNATGATISDVLVDGVTTHDTTAGAGMTIGGGREWTCAMPCITGTNITVRNSTSYNVYGDGIVIWSHENGLIENSVSYESGKCILCSGSTPVGIWTWNTNNVTVQNTESYSHHTWATAGGDGGGYDVDGDNLNNTYQYNYAHDSEGFCVAIYDFSGAVNTINAVFRYNICASNVQQVVGYSEIRVAAWQGGNLENMQIYNNTIYANPAPATRDGNEAVFRTNAASYVGNNFVKNNIAYSNVPLQAVIGNGGPLAFNYNLYWTTTGVGYLFKRLSTTYTSLSAWQSGTGQDLNSISADPKLNGVGYHGVGMPSLANGFYTLQTTSPALGAGTNVCATSCVGGSMGTRDFFGISLDATHNIGAYEGNGQ